MLDGYTFPFLGLCIKDCPNSTKIYDDPIGERAIKITYADKQAVTENAQAKGMPLTVIVG